MGCILAVFQCGPPGVVCLRYEATNFTLVNIDTDLPDSVLGFDDVDESMFSRIIYIEEEEERREDRTLREALTK